MANATSFNYKVVKWKNTIQLLCSWLVNLIICLFSNTKESPFPTLKKLDVLSVTWEKLVTEWIPPYGKTKDKDS